MNIESKLAQIGSTKEPVTGAVSFPIYHATAYRHPALGQSTGFDYTRTKNPTRAVLEEAIAELEGGVGGYATSSGMAAIQLVLSLFQGGDHIICSLDLYGGTYRILEQLFSRFGIRASYVDTTDFAALEAARQSNTKALLVETPTNPLMVVTDINAISDWAKERDLLVIVDNTLMTPYFQRPIEDGADIILHSATKYLGGHNDVLAGLVVAKTEELATQLNFLHNTIGSTLGPQDSWLLMRGMKTLALRMKRHEENAYRIAEFLAHHPLVENVYFPGLADHPQYDIQQRQTSGQTGIFSFEVKDAKLVAPILAHIQLIAFAESLGGTESLMTYPAVQTHADIPLAIREAVGVTDKLLRLSTGIESADDLIADLTQAFEKAEQEIYTREDC